MTNEEDPKKVASDARKTPQTEKILRQFLRVESTMDVRKFNANYDTAFGRPRPLPDPRECVNCRYVACTIAEVEWHRKQTGHQI